MLGNKLGEEQQAEFEQDLEWNPTRLVQEQEPYSE